MGTQTSGSGKTYATFLNCIDLCLLWSPGNHDNIIAQVGLVVYPAYHLRALHSSVGIHADGIPSEP
jgi:hypothetical protein